jgi:HNH endonuclease
LPKKPRKNAADPNWKRGRVKSMIPPAIDVFNDSYIPEPNSGCWLWTKGLAKAGYGLLQRGDYTGTSHRFSYLTFKGPIPEGMFVCHTCDVRSCVNPDHLWLGTAKDNSQDCSRKGRNYIPGCVGEDHGGSIMTEDKVRELRRLREDGYNYPKLSKEFGISKATVCQIVRRKTWKHI